MPAQPLTITPELLQRAWQRRPRHWPDSVDACLEHPVFRGLLRAAALGLAEADRRRAALAAQADAPTPATPAAAPARQRPAHYMPTARPAQAAPFDPKRLAAGDTDDDD